MSPSEAESTEGSNQAEEERSTSSSLAKEKRDRGTVGVGKVDCLVGGSLKGPCVHFI